MTQRIAGPAAEPLTLSEARDFLRLDQTDEDTLVAALVAAARQMVETATGRALLNQDWRITRDAWPPSGIFPLPVAPVSALIAARVRHADGTQGVLPEGALRLIADRTPALVEVALSTVPRPGVARGGIVIDIRAGYGASADDVPPDLVQAVRLVLAHLHEHRDGPGDTARLPATVTALIAPYRLVRL